MFESIKNIAVDRKNSLPIADLRTRYRATGIPVVLGDLSKRWPATNEWTLSYLSKRLGDIQVPIYSNAQRADNAHISKPLLNSELSRYLDELIHLENDFRVSRLLLKDCPDIAADFDYPRLGFEFNPSLSSLDIGGRNAVEPMRQSSDIKHSVYCHFGDPCSVLLIPPSQSELVYPVRRSRLVVSSIDFTKPHFGKFPALQKLSGYVAELNHGDALYIPAGFWYCTAYQGIGVNLCMAALDGTFSDYVRAFHDSLLRRLARLRPTSDARLKRLELRAHRLTNAKFSEL